MDQKKADVCRHHIAETVIQILNMNDYSNNISFKYVYLYELNPSYRGKYVCLRPKDEYE